ncbi:unnamed protein product [Paramecium octaurelia]|uniref:Uncharacterized protein n=1 Tax=Paramecium octaurelia TaxID=43137 RepID=A0A8S1W619_PAROT|nr:unnamed protein product [Paramecium octaurelia]
MTTPKFNIEDCSESEKEETQKKSFGNQPLFQTSLFETTHTKQLKKKPLAKLTLQDFLTNYDQNFDDVFGEQELQQPKEQISKKKKKKPAQEKKQKSDSESEFKSIPKKQKIIDSEQSNEKQIEYTLVKEQTSKNQKKHRLTKINSSKLTSEEKSNEVKRYDPNSIDLPENTKAIKKNYKLRKFLFSFGLEQYNPEDDQEQEEEKEEQVEEQKESAKELKNKNNKKKNNNNTNDNNDNQIEQLDIEQIENKKRRKQPEKKNSKLKEIEKQKEQKQPEVDLKTMLNLDTLKLNVYIPECNPKDNVDDINQ